MDLCITSDILLMSDDEWIKHILKRYNQIDATYATVLTKYEAEIRKNYKDIGLNNNFPKEKNNIAINKIRLNKILDTIVSNTDFDYYMKDPEFIKMLNIALLKQKNKNVATPIVTSPNIKSPNIKSPIVTSPIVKSPNRRSPRQKKTEIANT
jgi:hypothetical protein